MKKPCRKCGSTNIKEYNLKNSVYMCVDCDKARKQSTATGVDFNTALELNKKTECDACGDSVEGLNKHLDHCHKTGIARGILCSGCNLALGHAKDDIKRLEGLIVYLKDRSFATS